MTTTTTTPVDDSPGSERPPESNRRTAIRGSIIEIGGFGLTQIIRLGGNLILTRLLFPEAFGLAAIVSIVISGLELLSDVGFGQSVVQNERGDEPGFLDTAWSLQVIRGFVLAGLCLLLAYPLALLYEQPILFWLLSVSSLQSILQGFNSTSLFTLRRHVRLLPIASMEIAGQVTSVLVMILWCQFDVSVWALIAGGFARSAVRLVGSHLLPVGYRNHFRIERRARDQILSFGKWILGSTAIFFVSRQADRLMVGKLLGVATLGVFSIASMLAEVIELVASRLTNNVFFPIFSRIGKEGVGQLRRFYYRARLPIDSVLGTGLGFLFVFGSTVVEVVWDERYSEAGWMFELLCLRVAMAAVLYPCDRCLLAMGETRYPFYRSLVRAVWVLVGVPLGWYLDGTHGLVLAAALAELPVFFVLWPPFRRLGMLRLERELLAAGFFIAGAILGLIVDPIVSGWLHSGGIP